MPMKFGLLKTGSENRFREQNRKKGCSKQLVKSFWAPGAAYSSLARRPCREQASLVDRAGFEPAALRSRVSAFPQSGSTVTCQAGDLRPANAAYQADLPAHKKRERCQLDKLVCSSKPGQSYEFPTAATGFLDTPLRRRNPETRLRTVRITTAE